ncbi:MAG: DUF2845 domain-containing protein [Gammaproteobacteria bacterium]|nr:DUF2845 domain-containing protein [Gammaproteobacteria bacterium]
MGHKGVIGAGLCLLLATFSVAADHMRCGSYLVKIGDTKDQVVKRCGEPVYREEVSAEVERSEEQWVYDPGSAAFRRILTFRGLRLVDIETVRR